MDKGRWFKAFGLVGNMVWIRSDAVQVFGPWCDGKYGDGCKLHLAGGDEVFVRASAAEMAELLNAEEAGR